MQSYLFQPGRPVIFTFSTGERVDAAMKGPSEKGELFAVLEFMKGGQVVTHRCVPLQKFDFFIGSPSPSPEPSSPLPSPVAEVPREPEGVAQLCPKPRHPTKVPPRAAAAGQLTLTMKDFFICFRPDDEDDVITCVGSFMCCVQATPLSKLQ